MKIQLKQPVWVKNIELPTGEYQVSVDADNEMVILSQADKSFSLDAKRRYRVFRFKHPSVELRQVVGEPRWLLLVRSPPVTEWVVSLTQKPDIDKSTM